MTEQQLVDLFTYHTPNQRQVNAYAEIRTAARDLALTINRLCPESREKSSAITWLQMANMLANASIAIHGKDILPAPEPVLTYADGSKSSTPTPKASAVVKQSVLKTGPRICVACKGIISNGQQVFSVELGNVLVEPCCNKCWQEVITGLENDPGPGPMPR